MPKNIYRVNNGTEIIEKDTGYIRVKIKSGLWRRKQCVVMEKHLGRKLKKGEQVHHKNENKSDNRLSNLLLTTNSKHHLIHYEKSGFRQYNDKRTTNRLKERKNCEWCGRKFAKPSNITWKSWRTRGFCNRKCYRKEA